MGSISRQQAYWLCQFGGWGVYSIFNALLVTGYMRLSTRSSMVFLSYAFLGIAVTHGLRAWIRHSALLTKAWPRIALHVAVMVPVGAFALTSLMTLDWYLFTGQSMSSPNVKLSAVLVGIAFNMSFLMLLWLSIYIAVHLFWRSIAQREAQLNALQAQINPHFLFNSLNSLRALIVENPTAAQDAVTRLSQLMRYSLSQSRRPTVPLCEELEAIRDYVAIEKIRFEDRLEVDWQIEAGLDKVEVPPMCLQSLVENALKHGIAKLPAGGKIEILVARTTTGLTLRVTNPGNLSPSNSHSTGTGLNNIRERLQILRGAQAKLKLIEEAGQVQATIYLPAA